VYFFIQFTPESREESKTKSTLRFLIGAEVIVFGTDIVPNILLYTKLYLPRAMIQPFCSALKLRIEFIVLNSLVYYSKSKSRSATLPSWVSQNEIGRAQVTPALVAKDPKASNGQVPVDFHHGLGTEVL
jgi:hypothetical protein